MKRATVAPQGGTLILVDHASGPQLAVVLGYTKGKIQLLAENGDSYATSPAKLLLTVPFEINVDDSAAAFRQLAALVEEAKTAEEGIDLELLWQFARENHSSLQLSELATLWFGHVDAVAFLATRAKLDGDSLYFHKRGDLWCPARQEEIERAKAKEAERAQHEADRQDFLSIIEEIVQGTKTPVELTLRPGLRAQLHLLLDYASIGGEFERKAEAQELLSQTGVYVGRAMGRSARGAFELLTLIGQVSEHENLALRRYKINPTFSQELRDEAMRLATAPQSVDSSCRDFTDLEVFTIDAQSSADLDDALHVRFLPSGATEIGVHITDVGSVIEPGSALDLKARRQGASIYLPEGIAPMFPEELSESRLSLERGLPRQTISYLFTFDRHGNRTSAELCSGRVVVRHRLSYEEADTALVETDHPLHKVLAALEQPSRRCRQLRDAAGATVVDLPEIRVKLVADQIAIMRAEFSPSRHLVMEMMIQAGALTAEYCLRNKIPTVFRTQAVGSDRDELDHLDTILDPLARSLEQIRHMRRGELRTAPEPHRGLGLEAYSQSTSPIRRYSDLIVNYQLRRFLRNEPLVFDNETLLTVAQRVEKAAQACAAAQRDSERYWFLEYLKRNEGKTVDAVVMYHDQLGKKPRAPVVLPDTLLRGSVKAKGLRAGQRIQVRIVRADPRLDLIQLEAC